MLFRRIVDLDSAFAAVVYSALKPGECTMLRSRLGPSLIRLLPQDEPDEALPDDTAVVFLTEQGDGLLNDDPRDGGHGGAAQVLSLVELGEADDEAAREETQTAESAAPPPAEEGKAAAEDELAAPTAALVAEGAIEELPE